MLPAAVVRGICVRKRPWFYHRSAPFVLIPVRHAKNIAESGNSDGPQVVPYGLKIHVTNKEFRAITDQAVRIGKETATDIVHSPGRTSYVAVLGNQAYDVVRAAESIASIQAELARMFVIDVLLLPKVRIGLFGIPDNLVDNHRVAVSGMVEENVRDAVAELERILAAYEVAMQTSMVNGTNLEAAVKKLKADSIRNGAEDRFALQIVKFGGNRELTESEVIEADYYGGRSASYVAFFFWNPDLVQVLYQGILIGDNLSKLSSVVEEITKIPLNTGNRLDGRHPLPRILSDQELQQAVAMSLMRQETFQIIRNRVIHNYGVAGFEPFKDLNFFIGMEGGRLVSQEILFHAIRDAIQPSQRRPCTG